MSTVHLPELEVCRAGHWPADGIECDPARRILTISLCHPRKYQHRPNITIEVNEGDGWAPWYEVPKVPRQFERAFSIQCPLRVRLAVGSPLVASSVLPLLLPEAFQVNITQS